MPPRLAVAGIGINLGGPFGFAALLQDGTVRTNRRKQHGIRQPMPRSLLRWRWNGRCLCGLEEPDQAADQLGFLVAGNRAGPIGITAVAGDADKLILRALREERSIGTPVA